MAAVVAMPHRRLRAAAFVAKLWPYSSAYAIISSPATYHQAGNSIHFTGVIGAAALPPYRHRVRV